MCGVTEGAVHQTSPSHQADLLLPVRLLLQAPSQQSDGVSRRRSALHSRRSCSSSHISMIKYLIWSFLQIHEMAIFITLLQRKQLSLKMVVNLSRVMLLVNSTGSDGSMFKLDSNMVRFAFIKDGWHLCGNWLKWCKSGIRQNSLEAVAVL